MRVKNSVGYALVGISSSNFCFDLPLDQLKRGARLTIDMSKTQVIMSKTLTGFAWWYRSSCSHLFLTGQPTLCLLVPEAIEAAPEFLGEDGKLLAQCQESYSFSQYHERASARTGDWFVVGCNSLLMLERFAAVQTAARYVKDWLAAILKATETGSRALDGSPSSFVWARLTPAELLKVMAVTSVSWKTAEPRFGEFGNNPMTWVREGEGKTVHFGSKASFRLNVQLVMLARVPSSVQEATAVDFLPEPGGCVR